MFKKLKEHKRKYFNNWIDFFFCLGIPLEEGGFFIALYFVGGFLGLGLIWFGCWLLHILYEWSGLI